MFRQPGPPDPLQPSTSTAKTSPNTYGATPLTTPPPGPTNTNTSATPTGSAPVPPTDGDAALLAVLEEDIRQKRLHDGATYELEKREIRRLADALERADQRKPVRRSLTDELALPDDEQLYAINRLLPLGGNALFAGRYKAGKTTFNGQLLKAWADGTPFLGEFTCHPDPQRPVITIFNYEMSEGHFRRWLRRVGIRNQHLVHVVHLRGLSLPLALPNVRDEIAGWLAEANTGMWVVDPASRAMAGAGDINSNTDVALWLSYLDEIKLNAGVRDLVLNIHMGHAAAADKDAERAIGAQAWSAWADALWYLTKDRDECRWFHASGRDVDVDKMLVSYQADDMSIALVDTDPETQKLTVIERKVLETISNEPGIGVTRIREAVGGRNNDVIDVIDKLIHAGTIATRPGPRRKTEHYLSSEVPKLSAGMDGVVQEGGNRESFPVVPTRSHDRGTTTS